MDPVGVQHPLASTTTPPPDPLTRSFHPLSRERCIHGTESRRGVGRRERERGREKHPPALEKSEAGGARVSEVTFIR